MQDKSKDSKAHPLSVQNIGGVFVVLLCGLALAIMVSKENPPSPTGDRGQGEDIQVIIMGLCVCVS